jgi:hypothetical protein
LNARGDDTTAVDFSICPLNKYNRKDMNCITMASKDKVAVVTGTSSGIGHA